MNGCVRVLVASSCICLPGGALAGQSGELNVTSASGELTAACPDGSVVWRVRLPESAVPLWQRCGNDGIVLSDGTAIDEFGTVLARSCDTRGAFARGGDTYGRTCPHWSDLAEIAPAPSSGQSNQHNAPFFDSRGNAWVVLVHKDGSDYYLQVRRSNGHDGTWQPVETICDSTNYVSGPEGAIDPNDNITVVFRDIAGGYKLYSMRYEPGVGWTGPNLVYSTPDFFQAIEAGVDHGGNAVAVFDPRDTVWSTIYDAATGTWGPAHQVSPPGYSTMLPTVVHNRAGTAVYLIYLVRSGGPRGLYAHRFDSTTKTWGPAEFLPGSDTASFSGAGPASRYPAAADRFDEATVFWQSSTQGVYASRTAAGVWQPAYELLPPGPHGTDLVNFADAGASEFGDAFGVITRYESGPNRFYAFRYRVGSGWDEPDNPYTSGMNISTRARINFYRGAHAVATLYGLDDGNDQLISLLYNGVSWLPGLLDVPQEWPAFFQEIEDDRGESLLVLEAEELVGANYGIWASWLRNLAGDLDGDCDVDLSDLAILLASYNVDNGGDIDGDGDTDLSDLALLLANYGRVCP